MAVLPIVKYPDPRLRQKTVRVERITEDIRALCRDLADTMVAAHGVGIAAIQVGTKERLFLLEAKVGGGGENDPPLVFVNPELVALGREVETQDEGCLSFPGIFVPITRAVQATIRAMDLEGKTFTLAGEHLCARAFQHEMDHLNGKLLIDFVGPLKKQLIKRTLKHGTAAASSTGDRL